MQTVEAKRLELDPGDRVLDVGCGGGRHLRAVLNHQDVHGVGTDRSRPRIRESFRKLWTYPLTGTGSLTRSDALRLPFAGESFDAVICAEVLEHVDDHRQALREMIRVLRPGGLLGISVPGAFPEAICWRLNARYPETVGHQRIIDPRQLLSVLEALGAPCEKRTQAHAFHTPLWWIACLTGDFDLPLHPEEVPDWIMDPGDHGFFNLSILRKWFRGGENHPSRVVSAYLKGLQWYEANRPGLLTGIERLLNPWMGYSEVFYCRKTPHGPG